MEIQQLQAIATQVRRDIVRMVSGANSGHPGGSLGCADFLTVLYFEMMKHNPDHFSVDGKEEDLFFLSNGHISPVWYSVLARAGYFPIEELSTFRKLNARLQGHPSTDKKIPGVRMASGSLGQGLSNAIGAALTKKLNHQGAQDHEVEDDGELQEGQQRDHELLVGREQGAGGRLRGGACLHGGPQGLRAFRTRSRVIIMVLSSRANGPDPGMPLPCLWNLSSWYRGAKATDQ